MQVYGFLRCATGFGFSLFLIQISGFLFKIRRFSGFPSHVVFVVDWGGTTRKSRAKKFETIEKCLRLIFELQKIQTFGTKVRFRVLYIFAWGFDGILQILVRDYGFWYPPKPPSVQADALNLNCSCSFIGITIKRCTLCANFSSIYSFHQYAFKCFNLEKLANFLHLAPVRASTEWRVTHKRCFFHFQWNY